MAEDDDTEKPAAKKGGLGPLIIGLVLALAFGGGAAYGVMSGLVPLPFLDDGEAGAGHAEGASKAEPPVFVEFEPLTLTIGAVDAPRQLRIAFAVETTKAHAAEIEQMRPRILDSLNTLLRAVDDNDLGAPYALDRLRAQMARRVGVAVGPERVTDVLIVQYIIL